MELSDSSRAFFYEHMLTWHGNVLARPGPLSESDRVWRPPRLIRGLSDIGIVHFSGDVKFWHMCVDFIPGEVGTDDSHSGHRRAVEHIPGRWKDVDQFAEHLIMTCCGGYTRWVERAAPTEEYTNWSCRASGYVSADSRDKKSSSRHNLQIGLNK